METLLFHLYAVASLKRNNMSFHSVLMAERDAAEQAKIVRNRVYKFAFDALRANHGYSRNRD